MARDLYTILGVSRDASPADIRTAYKQLAKEHHPDKGGDAEKFKELSEAHEVLSNEGRRKMYDMTGATSESDHGPQGMPFGMPEVFSQMFGGMFPGQGPPNRRQKGPGKTQDLPLRIADFYHGRNISIKFGRQISCSTCDGSGAASTKTCEHCGGRGQVQQMVQMGPIQMVSNGPCHPCQGKGTQNVGQCKGCQGRRLLPDEKVLEIIIEPGMIPGNTVTFQGMCSANPNYSEPGDVVIVMREADEEGMAATWTRDGTTLKTTVSVNLTEVLLGTKRVLQGHPGFPNGVTVEIPAGVQNMSTGTVPDLGMPIRGKSMKGEGLVTVRVVPTVEEIEALKTNAIMLKSMLPAIVVPDVADSETRKGRWP